VTDPRIPGPRRLPEHLQTPGARQAPEAPPEPKPAVSAELVRYLEKNFPEAFYAPEETSNERVWHDMGVRGLVRHLRKLHDAQNATKDPT